MSDVHKNKQEKPKHLLQKYFITTKKYSFDQVKMNWINFSNEKWTLLFISKRENTNMLVRFLLVVVVIILLLLLFFIVTVMEMLIFLWFLYFLFTVPYLPLSFLYQSLLRPVVHYYNHSLKYTLTFLAPLYAFIIFFW